MTKLNSMKIKNGDKVIMLSGKDKGKSGKVLQVFPKEAKVVVEGLNLAIKHQRPRRQGEKGQRIQFPTAVPVSKVALICPHCGKGTRVGYKIEDKKKVRICSKCKEIV